MRALPLSILIVSLPSVALAHAGHDQGSFLAGALHPIGGADHVLAMVAVGLLAAQIGGRALWATPASFLAAMMVGGMIGFAGLPFPAVEPMILVSIMLLGVSVALAQRLPLAVMLPVVAVFGAAHGWAHGVEGPGAGLAAYALGFLMVTAGLHGVGIALGRTLGALPLRLMGGAAALTGALLAVA